MPRSRQRRARRLARCGGEFSHSCQRAQRRAEVGLAPREVLAERASRQVAGSAERAREGHAARRVRETAAPDRVRLDQRGAVERPAAAHDAEPVRAAHDVDAAVHRLELSVRVTGRGRCARACRCNRLQRRCIRGCASTLAAGAAKPRTIAVRDWAIPIARSWNRCPFGANPARSFRDSYNQIRNLLRICLESWEFRRGPPDSPGTRDRRDPCRARAPARRGGRSSRCASSAARRRTRCDRA